MEINFYHNRIIKTKYIKPCTSNRIIKWRFHMKKMYKMKGIIIIIIYIYYEKKERKKYHYHLYSLSKRTSRHRHHHRTAHHKNNCEKKKQSHCKLCLINYTSHFIPNHHFLCTPLSLNPTLSVSKKTSLSFCANIYIYISCLAIQTASSS